MRSLKTATWASIALLVGAEIGAGLGSGAAPPYEVVLIGEADLCRRYEQALRLAGVPCHRADAEGTTRGQWRLACAAGLVAEGSGAVSGLAGVADAAPVVGVTP